MLVEIQRGETLHLDEIWDEAAHFVECDGEIVLKEERMIVFARRRLGRRAMERWLGKFLEIGPAQHIADLFTGFKQLPGQVIGHENGRLRYAKGRRFAKMGGQGLEQCRIRLE
jgi:hypothetical protein